jgi:hypothetical protein
VWSEAEYAKLPEYDRPTAYQPTMVFQCHQNDRDDPQARICGGWAGTHKDLLAVRIGVAIGVLDEETAVAVMDYESPVPLFESGQDAYEHGVMDIDDPSQEACALVEEIARKRGLL